MAPNQHCCDTLSCIENLVFGYLFGYNLRFYKTKSTKKRATIGTFLVSKETRWRKSVKEEKFRKL